MARRSKISRRRSKRSFSRNAVKVNTKNIAAPMRGGIRL